MGHRQPLRLGHKCRAAWALEEREHGLRRLVCPQPMDKAMEAVDFSPMCMDDKAMEVVDFNPMAMEHFLEMDIKLGMEEEPTVVAWVGLECQGWRLSNCHRS